MDYHLHAGMSEQDYNDFINAVTGEFAEVLEASAPEGRSQECFDSLLEVYGLEFNPVRLHETTEAQIHELREAFSSNLDAQQVTEDNIRDAVARAKARWPMD